MRNKPPGSSEPSGGQKRGNPTMETQRTSSGTAWAKTLRRYELMVMKASGPACKVFLALKFHANCDGYCWPLVSTLQRFTGIRKRDTIFAALRELESLGIVYRQQLISRRGRNSPNLYRIGRKVEAVPENADHLYVLGPARRKAGRRPAKRDLGDLACEVPPNGTTVVPSNGATGVPPDGTQNHSREPLDGTSSSREGAVPQVSPAAEAESSPNTQLRKDATAAERAFVAFGYDAPFGHPGFRYAVLRNAKEIRNGNKLEIMERVIVELDGKVPPQWYSVKHHLEEKVANGRNSNVRESFHEKRSRTNAEAIARVLPDGVSALVGSVRRALPATNERHIDRVLPRIAERSEAGAVGCGLPPSDANVGVHAHGCDDPKCSSQIRIDRRNAIDVHSVSRGDRPRSQIVAGRGSADSGNKKENRRGGE